MFPGLVSPPPPKYIKDFCFIRVCHSFWYQCQDLKLLKLKPRMWSENSPNTANRGCSTGKIIEPGGAGKARFNVATPTNATVTCTAYVLPYNFQTKSI